MVSMTKYTQYARNAPAKPRPWKVHPVWRGIGCILMIIIPVLSYAISVELINANFVKGWIFIPGTLLRPIPLPYLRSIPILPATLIVTLLLMILGFGVLVSIYSLIYRFTGPPTLGPLDAPPERRRPRHK
jgi:hypothetical protein